MQNNFIELMEPTPVLRTKKCKFIAMALRFFLQYTSFILAAIAWYFYDYFIAIAALLLSFIIMGIIRSKLSNASIPLSQREFQYNDKGIADWYTAKVLCFEESEEI